MRAIPKSVRTRTQAGVAAGAVPSEQALIVPAATTTATRGTGEKSFIGNLLDLLSRTSGGAFTPHSGFDQSPLRFTQTRTVWMEPPGSSPRKQGSAGCIATVRGRYGKNVEWMEKVSDEQYPDDAHSSDC